MDAVLTICPPSPCRQNRDDAIDCAAKIDAHHPVPVGEGGQFRRPHDGDPGVVTKHVNFAKASLGCIGGARKVGSVGHIQLKRQYLLRRAQLGLCGLKMIVADIGDDYIHARAEQRLGNAESNAAGAAGYERGLA
jgi:hypothetical protein